MEIRKYIPKDKVELIELLRLNTPQYFSPIEEKDLIHYLDNDANNHYVLIIDDKIVGTGGFILSKDKTTGMLSWDFFHSDHQGKGLGTTLTRFRIERMKEIKSVKQPLPMHRQGLFPLPHQICFRPAGYLFYHLRQNLLQ